MSKRTPKTLALGADDRSPCEVEPMYLPPAEPEVLETSLHPDTFTPKANPAPVMPAYLMNGGGTAEERECWIRANWHPILTEPMPEE